MLPLGASESAAVVLLILGIAGVLAAGLIGVAVGMAVGWWLARRTAARPVEGMAEIDRRARTDALTGAASRWELEYQLGCWGERSLEDRQRWSLVMLDLDRFKEVNDRAGHLAGDQLLRDLVAFFQEQRQSGGPAWIGRYGGDEWVLLWEARPERVVERLEESLARWSADPRSRIPGSDDRVRWSAGVVSLAEGQQPSGWLQLADQRMYQKKLSGHIS
ncbi:MAG: GGDEF domain-containing protein [Pirellulaceae bacterium]